MTQTLIVPGLDGLPTPHWQQRWAATEGRAINVCGAEAVDLCFAGHGTVATGFGPWPQGKPLRDAIALRSAPPSPAHTHHAQRIAR